MRMEKKTNDNLNNSDGGNILDLTNMHLNHERQKILILYIAISVLSLLIVLLFVAVTCQCHNYKKERQLVLKAYMTSNSALDPMQNFGLQKNSIPIESDRENVVKEFDGQEEDQRR